MVAWIRICFNPKPCIICYTRPRSVRLTCGHGVLCSQCWSQCKQAPGAPIADCFGDKSFYPAEKSLKRVSKRLSLFRSGQKLSAGGYAGAPRGQTTCPVCRQPAYQTYYDGSEAGGGGGGPVMPGGTQSYVPPRR